MLVNFSLLLFGDRYSVIVVVQISLTIYDDGCRPTFIDRFLLAIVCQLLKIMFWWLSSRKFYRLLFSDNRQPTCWLFFIERRLSTFVNCFRLLLLTDFQLPFRPNLVNLCSLLDWLSTTIDNSWIDFQQLHSPTSSYCCILTIVWPPPTTILIDH